MAAEMSRIREMEVLGWAMSLTCFVITATVNPYIGHAFALDELMYGIVFFAFTMLIGSRLLLGILPTKSTDVPDPAPRTKIEKAPARSTAGYVYLLSIETGLYKIGLTTTVEGRISGLSTGLPYDLKLIHKIKCRDRFKIEKFFHEKFADKRVRGEWFRLDQDDIDYFMIFTEA